MITRRFLVLNDGPDEIFNLHEIYCETLEDFISQMAYTFMDTGDEWAPLDWKNPDEVPHLFNDIIREKRYREYPLDADIDLGNMKDDPSSPGDPPPLEYYQAIIPPESFDLTYDDVTRILGEGQSQ